MPPHCAPPAWEEMLSPATFHATDHGWDFGGQHSHVLRLPDILNHIAHLGLRPQSVRVADVCHKNMTAAKGLGSELDQWKAACESESRKQTCHGAKRTATACTSAMTSWSAPGILVRTAENPCKLPYRLVDGAHRLCKLKRELLDTTGTARRASAPFYVLAEADALHMLTSARQNVEPLSVNEAVCIGWYLRAAQLRLLGRGAHGEVVLAERGEEVTWLARCMGAQRNGTSAGVAARMGWHLHSGHSSTYRPALRNGTNCTAGMEWLAGVATRMGDTPQAPCVYRGTKRLGFLLSRHLKPRSDAGERSLASCGGGGELV